MKLTINDKQLAGNKIEIRYNLRNGRPDFYAASFRKADGTKVEGGKFLADVVVADNAEAVAAALAKR